MIDLTTKELADIVCVGGVEYPIHTDFRLWMRFEIEAGRMKQGQQIEVSYLFKEKLPPHCSLQELFAFSRPVSVLPRQIKHSRAIALDYELDADYIFSAFLSQYGIDLMEVESLHWHKFLAMLKGLKEDEMLSRIMSWRCYEKQDANHDIYEELRFAWEIDRISEEEEGNVEKFSSLFG